MTKNLDLNGLHSIADNYDLFYIDLWGVIHNGINLYEQAVVVLEELASASLTNPNSTAGATWKRSTAIDSRSTVDRQWTHVVPVNVDRQ